MPVSVEVVAAGRWQPRRPQLRGEQRRTRLLEALEQRLERHPFADVNIADVTDAAGLGRSAFYFYFSSKHDAVTQLLGDVFDEEITRAGEIVYGEGNPRDNIADALAFIVASWRQRRTLLLAMLDARDGDAEARLIWEHWLGRYEDFVVDYIARTTAIAVPKGRALAHVLIAMNERALERHLRSGAGRESAAELHEALVHVWQTTLRSAG